jgi:hypothetical protein
MKKSKKPAQRIQGKLRRQYETFKGGNITRPPKQARNSPKPRFIQMEFPFVYSRKKSIIS